MHPLTWHSGCVCRGYVSTLRYFAASSRCIVVLLYRIPPHRYATWPIHCVLVMWVLVYLPYVMVCTSTSFTVPSWYRPIGEIAPGCLLSAAALPGKAVRSIYQFSIAPTGEMAPGIIAPVCVRWHPSVRWHRGGPKNTRKKYLEVFYEKF